MAPLLVARPRWEGLRDRSSEPVASMVSVRVGVGAAASPVAGCHLWFPCEPALVPPLLVARLATSVARLTLP